MSRVELDSSGQTPSPTASSADELPQHHHNGDLAASGGYSDSTRSSSSTVSSLMELGWTEDEHFTIERLQRTRKQLEDEIEVYIVYLVRSSFKRLFVYS